MNAFTGKGFDVYTPRFGIGRGPARTFDVWLGDLDTGEGFVVELHVLMDDEGEVLHLGIPEPGDWGVAFA